MYRMQNAKRIVLLLVLLTGVSACSKQNSAEDAGKKIDQAAESASNKIGETVDKVDKSIETQTAKTAMAIDDATVTTKVKAAIFAEPALKSLQIGVDTVDGVVTLTGSVDTEQNSDRVKTLAAAVAGVKHVDNQLRLK